MEPSVTRLSSALGEGETNRVGDHPNHLDAEAEAEMTAKMQRRKVQNRKNQGLGPLLVPFSSSRKPTSSSESIQSLFAVST